MVVAAVNWVVSLRFGGGGGTRLPTLPVEYWLMGDDGEELMITGSASEMRTLLL